MYGVLDRMYESVSFCALADHQKRNCQNWNQKDLHNSKFNSNRLRKTTIGIHHGLANWKQNVRFVQYGVSHSEGRYSITLSPTFVPRNMIMHRVILRFGVLREARVKGRVVGSLGERSSKWLAFTHFVHFWVWCVIPNDYINVKAESSKIQMQHYEVDAQNNNVGFAGEAEHFFSQFNSRIQTKATYTIDLIYSTQAKLENTNSIYNIT